MDALALLCTLHADGPATLKALRARGYSTITEFARLDGDRVAEDLGIRPAAARRLIREAKIIEQRIGLGDLEAEEAPPVAHRETGPPPELAIGDLPAPRAEALLDDGDRDLVARVAESSEVDASPAREPDRSVEPVEVTSERGLERVSEEIPAPTPSSGAGVLEVGALPGLDEAMIDDLRAAGVSTLAELGAAESLFLTRNLGVTFAQARRLRFLARRAAEALPETLHGAPSDRDALLPQPVHERPARATELREVTMPEPSSAHAPASEPTPEPQGVKIDPSEIEARPRFGEQFARAAAQGKLHRDRSSPGKTILGWNFEIPRPEEESLPLPSLSPGPAVSEEGAAVDVEERGEAAGPFA